MLCHPHAAHAVHAEPPPRCACCATHTLSMLWVLCRPSHCTLCLLGTQDTKETMVKLFGVKKVLRASRNWLLANERPYVPGASGADGALLLQVSEACSVW